jgi:hypothetical protein
MSTRQDSKKFLLILYDPLDCQIWLILLVDDGQSTYLAKLIVFFLGGPNCN